jgi:lysophospholipase L1-like esterase
MSVFERYPKTTLSIVLFLLILAIDILAATLFSAVGLYKPQLKIERYYRVQNEIYHHTLAANITHSDAIWGALGYKVNTNSLGFKDSRSRTISLKKKNHRILLIGDSFTEGIGYAHDDTFAGILENELNKDRKIDVLNAGVSSYSPIIYLRKTQYLINSGFEFDHLVVFIDISDIENEAKHYTFDDNGNVVDRPTNKSNELDERLKRFIAEDTILLSSLRVLIRKLKKTDKPRKLTDSLNIYGGLWTVNEDVYNDYGKKGLTLAKKHMTTLAELLEKHKIKLTIVVYPWPDQIFNNDLNSKQVEFWYQWSKNNNVNFINLFPTFINANESKKVIEKYFITGDVHWNKSGHKLVAKSVFPKLWENIPCDYLKHPISINCGKYTH